MILIIDNYDSFTYNLKQYLLEFNQKVNVVRNDKILISEIEKIKPSHIIISPGPGRPENAGITVNVIKNFSGKIPILGVCLGHQAIGLAFGGDIIFAKQLMHGKVSSIFHDSKGVFAGLPNGFQATRYHSLVVDNQTVPEILEVTARSDDDEIMAVRHKTHLTEGVQFHPESILTSEGKNILKNFLTYSYQQVADKPIVKNAISILIDGKDLSQENAKDVMNEIMEGRASDAQIAGILTAMRLKGESVDEIVAFARVMREKAIKILPKSRNLVDTCGTGGDSSGTFNISTAAAIVAAGAGIKVAKHGNRSISSKSGSADVLEALNVNLDLTPDNVARSIDEVGIGFMFAPKLHPAMKYAIGPRRELGIRTVFNILGPLTNPANAEFQVMGVYDVKLVEVIAEVLNGLGIKRGFVVSSNDGLDEVSISSTTKIAEIEDGRVKSYIFSPESLGLNVSSIKNVAGGDAKKNAEIIRNILNGEKSPARDIVVLNSAFSIAAVLNITLEKSLEKAIKSIDSGNALAMLENLVDFSNRI